MTLPFGDPGGGNGAVALRDSAALVLGAAVPLDDLSMESNLADGDKVSVRRTTFLSEGLWVASSVEQGPGSRQAKQPPTAPGAPLLLGFLSPKEPSHALLGWMMVRRDAAAAHRCHSNSTIPLYHYTKRFDF